MEAESTKLLGIIDKRKAFLVYTENRTLKKYQCH